MIRIYGEPTTEEALARLSRCADAAEERRERTLIFCEDSLTLLAERAVLRGSGATFLTEVTTFARFLEGDRQVLSKEGSVAAISAILSARKGQLACFSENAAVAVYETLAQLAASRVGEEELRMGAERTEGMLRGKLNDLALLLGAYGEFLREKGLLDENGYLALLPDRLASRGLEETNVIFFGFTSFTKQALEGIRAAVLHAKSVTGIFPRGERELLYEREREDFPRRLRGVGRGDVFTRSEHADGRGGAAARQSVFARSPRAKARACEERLSL